MTGACGLQQALWLQSRHARGAKEASADYCAHRLGSRVVAAHDAQLQDGWRCAVWAWQAPACRVRGELSVAIPSRTPITSKLPLLKLQIVSWAAEWLQSGCGCDAQL